MKALRTSAALLAAAITVPAFASSDGTPGASSSGTFTVTATVGPAAPGDTVHVFGLDDFSLSWAQGSSGDAEEHSFCIVSSNPAGGQVSITVSSFDAADTGFVVKEPASATQIPLFVGVVSNSQGLGHPMIEGTPVPGFTIAGSCTDSPVDPNAFILQVNTDDGASAGQGTYFGSFLITVAPG